MALVAIQAYKINLWYQSAKKTALADLLKFIQN